MVNILKFINAIDYTCWITLLWKEMKLGNFRWTISTGWLVFHGSIDSLHQTHLSHHTVNPSPWPPNKYVQQENRRQRTIATKEEEIGGESEGGCEGGKEGVFVQKLTISIVFHDKNQPNQALVTGSTTQESRVTEQEILIGSWRQYVW